MRFACPHCHKKIRLNEAELTGLMTEFAAVAAKLGVHYDLVMEYADCFRPREEGYVRPKKRLRILREAAKLIESKEFDYNKKRYRTDISSIRWAMRMICNMQKEGLPNQNYLYKTLINRDCADRVSAEGLTAKEEREAESSKLNAQRTKEEMIPLGALFRRI